MGISLGLVGLGSFGAQFAWLFKSHPLVDRLALCDREVDRMQFFAEHPAFQDKFTMTDAYGSLDDLCQSDVDAVALITQPWLHAPQAVQVINAGKDVYSAVPIITIPDGDETLDWCNQLVDACASTGKHYMLGETTYYHPDMMYCRRQAAAGEFGHFVYAEGDYLHDVDSHGANLREVMKHRLNSAAGQEWLALSAKYAERGAMGGPMHYPTHSTCGPVCVMQAHAVKVACAGFMSPVEDEFHGNNFANETGMFRMSNNAIVRINEYRQIGHSGREAARIYGSKASYENEQWVTRAGSTLLTADEMRDPLPEEVFQAFYDQRARMDKYAGDRSTPGFYEDKDFIDEAVKTYTEEQMRARTLGGHGGSHAYLVHEFVAAVAQDRHPTTNIWEAARYMAMGIMAHKSALKDGEWLDVPDWGDAPSSR